MCAFNRSVDKVERFMANEAKGTNIIGGKSMEDMVAQLKRPRRIMLLVKAGAPVDDFIEKLVKRLCDNWTDVGLVIVLLSKL